MLDTAPNAQHNNPPAHIVLDDQAETLIELAEGMTAITNPRQAEEVGKLADDAGKARRDAESARKAAKQPHLDAGKAVDADFKPLIDKFDRVKRVTSALLTPWINEQRRIEQEAAAKARAERDAADAEARRIAAEADQSDIMDMERVARAEADAKDAEMAAKKARGQKTTVAGARMVNKSETTVDDMTALLRHIFATDKDALRPIAEKWAKDAARAGADDIPGVTVRRWQEAA